ncbi:uncharacterized protein IWZ02DRAFT_447264 [Phyllosticta citriasiana]|uniref:uncharacterized protein n=1 Tax=Phyllosticta citriasiana TaxID=595635 RepID=UPI0030FD987E
MVAHWFSASVTSPKVVGSIPMPLVRFTIFVLLIIMQRGYCCCCASSKVTCVFWGVSVGCGRSRSLRRARWCGGRL